MNQWPNYEKTWILFKEEKYQRIKSLIGLFANDKKLSTIEYI